MINSEKLKDSMEDLKMILKYSYVSEDGTPCWYSCKPIPPKVLKYLSLALYESSGMMSGESSKVLHSLESAGVDYSFGPGGVEFDGFI